MNKEIDVEQMFEEGSGLFNLCMAEAANDDSDDDFDIPSSVSTKRKSICSEQKKRSNDSRSVDVFSLKVEGKGGKEISFDDVYVDISHRKIPDEVKSQKREKFVNNVMKKCVIGPDFEKLEAVPPYEISRRKLLLDKRKKRESTKGESWFNMRAVEMTDEIKHDLEVLQMRSILDPKRFYKKNDMKQMPKYFHVGTVVESPTDFYSSRIPKKQRRSTMVDELLADAEFQQYNKQRYQEIIEEKKKTSFKAFRRANRMKRKGKDRKT